MSAGHSDAWSAVALPRVAPTPRTSPAPECAGGNSVFRNVGHCSPPDAEWRRCRHQCASFKSASAHTLARSGPPSQSVSWGALTPGSPKFLRNLNCPFAMFQTDAGRTAYTRPSSAAAWPLVIEWQRLPRKVFRRSIAWLSDSLSTLRSADYSNNTQDSLPVAGQALLDGLSTRKLPMKGFRFVIYISFPSLKLILAQSMQPKSRRRVIREVANGGILAICLHGVGGYLCVWIVRNFGRRFPLRQLSTRQVRQSSPSQVGPVAAITCAVAPWWQTSSCEPSASTLVVSFACPFPT